MISDNKNKITYYNVSENTIKLHKFFSKNLILKIIEIIMFVYLIGVILYILLTFHWIDSCGSDCGLLILPFMLFYLPLFIMAILHFIVSLSLLLLKKLDHHDKVLFVVNCFILTFPFIFFLILNVITI